MTSERIDLPGGWYWQAKISFEDNGYLMTPKNRIAAEMTRKNARAFAAALQQQQQQTPAGGEWHDFSTAPKNGTEVLLYLPKERSKVQIGKCLSDKLTWVVGGIFSYDLSKPTHWMPAPADPTPDQGSAS